MTQRTDFRIAGLLALSTVFAVPAIHAQNAAPMTGPEQTAVSQPASPPSPQAETAPAEKKSWAELDVDKNGIIEKAEAADSTSLLAVFDQADANADGSLTGEEYIAYLATKDQKQDDAPPTDKPEK